LRVTYPRPLYYHDQHTRVKLTSNSMTKNMVKKHKKNKFTIKQIFAVLNDSVWIIYDVHANSSF